MQAKTATGRIEKNQRGLAVLAEGVTICFFTAVMTGGYKYNDTGSVCEGVLAAGGVGLAAVGGASLSLFGYIQRVISYAARATKAAQTAMGVGGAAGAFHFSRYYDYVSGAICD